MPDDTAGDGLRTVLLASLLLGAPLAGSAAGAAAGVASPAVAAAGNAAAPTATVDVRPVTPFAGRRAVLVGDAAGLADATYDWRVETPTRGTVRLDGRRARFRFRTAGRYTVRLTVTGDDGTAARANTTVRLRRTTVRLRGADGPPGNATLVLDGDGTLGSGVYAVTDGSVAVLLRANRSYVATALQDRDRSTPLRPDPGPADGLADFAVLGRVTAGEATTLTLPTAAATTVRVVDADGDPVTLRRGTTPGNASLTLRHDPPGLPPGGFRGFETNATGAVTLSGRPPELTGNVTARVVPLADRFARTGSRRRRNLTVDGPTQTTFVLNDSAGPARTAVPQTAVVGESVPLNVTVAGREVVAAGWRLHGPDGATRRRAGAETTFVPRVAGRFRVVVRAETAGGETRLARTRLRVARRAAVAGRVRRPDGGPLADAVVRLFRVGRARSPAAVRNGTGVARGPSTVAVTRTDDAGRFEAVLAAGREYRTVVAQSPAGDPPTDGVPDVAVLGRFTAGVDAPGGRLPAPRRLPVTVETTDGDGLTAGLAGGVTDESVAVAVGHTPDGAGTTPVGWLPGVTPGGEADDGRPVVEVAGAATLLAVPRVGWLAPARANATATTDTARLRVPVTDQTRPSARLDGPRRASVGDSVRLDATGSTDRFGVADHAWDTDGDGAFETAGDATVTWRPGTAGRHTVRVRVRDPAGNHATASHTVVVAGDGGDTGDDGDDGGSGSDGDDGGDNTGDDGGDDTGDDGSDGGSGTDGDDGDGSENSDSNPDAGDGETDPGDGGAGDDDRVGDGTTPTTPATPTTPRDPQTTADPATSTAPTATPAGSVPPGERPTTTPDAPRSPGATPAVPGHPAGRGPWPSGDDRTTTPTTTPRPPVGPGVPSSFRPRPGVVPTATPPSAVAWPATDEPARGPTETTVDGSSPSAPSPTDAAPGTDPVDGRPPADRRETTTRHSVETETPATDVTGTRPLVALGWLLVAVAALAAVRLVQRARRDAG